MTLADKFKHSKAEPAITTVATIRDLNMPVAEFVKIYDVFKDSEYEIKVIYDKVIFRKAWQYERRPEHHYKIYDKTGIAYYGSLDVLEGFEDIVERLKKIFELHKIR